MNFEGTVGKYGKIFVTHTLYALEGDKSRGSLEGNARAILEDGTLLWSPLTGTFRREGSTAKFFFLDCINNGDQNFVVWDVDIHGKNRQGKGLFPALGVISLRGQARKLFPRFDPKHWC